jgi:hypothetical protein
MKYTELKQKQSEEFGNFPIRFAFSEQQLNKALADLAAERSECCSVGAGGIIRKTDKAKLSALVDKHTKEKQDFFGVDAQLIDAIKYELGNHEYIYTMDISDTVEALGLNLDDERVLKCLTEAKRQYWEENREQ